MMKTKILLCTILVSVFTNVLSSRILAIVPTPSYSHQVPFRSIWRELANRGHEITLLTTDPMNDPTLVNLKEIDLHGAYEYWEISSMIKSSRITPLAGLPEVLEKVNRMFEFELSHPEVQKILKNETEHFDVVMAEILMPIMFAFSHHFDCPTIGLASMESPTFIHRAMGNEVHSVLYPEVLLPFYAPLSFFQRVGAFIASLFFILFSNVMNATHDAIVKRYFAEDTPSVLDLYENTALLLLNTNPVLQPIRPLGPATIQIGGGAQLTPPKPLPKDLQSFLDGAKEGAIYLSLGTNVKYAHLEATLLETFLNTFKELPYRVLWKLDAEIPNLPKNVKIIPWGPQQDILRHPNVKLFIMQGGLQSTEEAIFLHVPMIVIPFVSDQIPNSKMTEKKGFGLIVDRNRITQTILTKTIEQVIKNPKYKDSTKKYAQLAVDQPMTGLEKAVWWTEYVIRHKGAPHLKNDYTIPAYQYYHLDVIAFISLILFIFLFIVYKLLKWVVKKICALFVSKPKTKVD